MVEKKNCFNKGKVKRHLKEDGILGDSFLLVNCLKY